MFSLSDAGDYKISNLNLEDKISVVHSIQSNSFHLGDFRQTEITDQSMIKVLESDKFSKVGSGK